MINWDNLSNPNLAPDELVNAREYVSQLETKLSSYEKDVSQLRETNQKLALRITVPIANDEPDKQVTSESIDEELTSLLIGGK